MRKDLRFAALAACAGMLAAAQGRAQAPTDPIAALTGTWDLVGTLTRITIHPDHTVDHSLLGQGDIQHDRADYYKITYRHRSLLCNYEIRRYRDSVSFTAGIPQDSPDCQLGTLQQPLRTPAGGASTQESAEAETRRLATLRQLIQSANTASELDLIVRMEPGLQAQVNDRRRALASAGPALKPLVEPAPTPAVGLHVRPNWCRSQSTFNQAEVVICGDDEVGQLDLQLQQAYEQLLSQSTSQNRSALTASQRNWNTVRDDCGSNRNCILRVYRGRIQQIAALLRD